MAPLSDFLKNTSCFETPQRLTDISSWHGHIPFAFAIVEMLRPKVFVELGVHKGDSYCAFCQAMRKSQLACACHGIDSWEGDEHAGFYGADTFEELRAYHDPLYDSFSKLLKMQFDEGIPLFSDNSIDLLHIDGRHSYKAVKHDFRSWLPKMSKTGVVLLHDTNIQEHGFGVGKFWAEIRDTYPSFEFFHSCGLGILGVGILMPEPVRHLLDSDAEAADQINRFFAGMGTRVACGIPIGTPRERKMEFNPNSPKVSVIIPAYNHEKYLKDAIDSVLNQTVTDLELIIINDGSTDDSEKVIRTVEDQRIRYFYQENQGAHHALNRGIRLAKGEYVSILNSDDLYHPDRFETCLNILEQDDTVHAVFSHIEMIDGQGNFTGYKKGAEENWANHDPDTSFKREENILLDLLAGNFLISTSNLFCRKSVFQEIGFFENLRYAHDYEFFLKLCYHLKVFIVKKPLFKYRVHGANTFNKDTIAETSFEVGLVLSNFFLRYDMKRIFPDDDIGTAMVRFFNSVNTFDADRMMMTLLVFGRISENHGEQPFGYLSETRFRKICMDRFQTHLKLWQESQDAWKKWHEANERLIRTDKRLSEKEKDAEKSWLSSQYAWKRLEDTEKQLAETQNRLSEMENEAATARESLGETEKMLAVMEKKFSEMNDKATTYWLNSQEAWQKWHEINDRLVRAEKELEEAKDKAVMWWSDSQEAWQKWRETNDRLIRTTQELSDAREDAAMWWSDSQEAWRKWSDVNQRLTEARKKMAEKHPSQSQGDA